MKNVVSFFGIFIFVASPCVLHAEDVLHVGGFSGLGPATDVAERQGFLDAENLVLEFERVDDSIELMTKLISGQYDIIQTNADNVIAWTEGQGIDDQTHDFIIVMGGYRGRAPLELVVGPDVLSVEDIRGQVLAVDAIDTGYSTMLVYMLHQEGLVWKKDYQLKSVGGGPMRREAMVNGKIIGGLVPLDDELKQKGFYTLLSSRDYITDYARGVTAARRDWAEQNEDLIMRYIRSMAGAINWLLDPDNKQAAIATIMAADDVLANEAVKTYEKAVNATFGFIPDARIEAAGIEQVLKLREVMGHMKHPLPSPDKYIESRFYQTAMDSLAH
jgi:ABC-type nitrate/sulfonate/bicarbonate transport system substrate-binding protein